MSRVERNRYTQDQIDQFVSAHERFQRGEPGGHRAILRFLQAPGIDFTGRVLTDADFSGADLRKARFASANLERVSFYGPRRGRRTPGQPVPRRSSRLQPA